MKMGIFEPKTAKRKLLPSERLDNVLTWRYKMFECGHPMSEIDELSYWDLVDYSNYANENRPKQPGEVRGKRLKPSQKLMIKERKEHEAMLKKRKL